MSTQTTQKWNLVDRLSASRWHSWAVARLMTWVMCLQYFFFFFHVKNSELWLSTHTHYIVLEYEFQTILVSLLPTPATKILLLIAAHHYISTTSQYLVSDSLSSAVVLRPGTVQCVCYWHWKLPIRQWCHWYFEHWSLNILILTHSRCTCWWTILLYTIKDNLYYLFMF